jgi:hypothetical protein
MIELSLCHILGMHPIYWWGFIFIHRYLLEHFATLYEEADQAKRGIKKEERP